MDQAQVESLKPGDVFELPIIQSPSRQVWTTDNTLVTSAGSPNPWLEITAVASSTVFEKQILTVRENPGEGALRVDKPNFRGAERAMDLGMMRMRPENGVDLALAVLSHVIDSGLMEKSVVDAKVREKLGL